MRILIIGGTGLISTAITRILLERKSHTVTLFNRGNHAVEAGSVTVIRGDRTNYAAFEKQMREAGTFDCVIDMIGYVPAEIESSLRAFAGSAGQYIFCSTVDVYTKPAAAFPIREDAERKPLPSFPYALNKAACEDLLLAAHKRRDFAVTILRPAQAYGGESDLVHALGWGKYYLRRIRQGKPIIVQGDGTSLWSACNRDDVAVAFANAVGNSEAFGRAYTVSGSEWMTWDQYHQGVAQAMDAPGPTFVHIPTEVLSRMAPEQALWCRENFQYNNIFDTSAAQAHLGFKQTISWRDGVRRLVGALDAKGEIDKSETPAWYDQIIEQWWQLSQSITSIVATAR